MKVLVLSGSIEGRRLAAALRAAGHAVIESLAGRTAAARNAARDGVRVGGFGGVPGLVAYLDAERPDCVVDATHPFAAHMSAHAAAACAQTGTPLLRLERPGWGGREDADGWHWVDSHDEAARAASGTVLLTVGRQHLDAYAALPDVIARVADAAGLTVPAAWTLIEATGPFGLDAEVGLLGAGRVDTLVAKDAGGDLAATKLDAAAILGTRVVMIRRPAAPAGVPTVAGVDEALAWVAAR